MIDLHLHSNYSDGVLSPAQLVAAAKQAGVDVISLCDHDCISGVAEAAEAGKISGVEVISGVELSVAFKDYRDVHLLGYFIDIESPILKQRLEGFADRRSNRNKEIIQLVNRQLEHEKLSTLEISEVEAFAEGVMGRPHIARALLARGYVSGMEDAFNRYLVPNNVPKYYWQMSEAIDLIRQVGGIAILAHPTSITRDMQLLSEIITELASLGIDGIEVYNSMASEHESTVLQGLANSLALIVTGGSDYHGVEKGVAIGRGRGGISFSNALLPPLRQLYSGRSEKS